MKMEKASMTHYIHYKLVYTSQREVDQLYREEEEDASDHIALGEADKTIEITCAEPKIKNELRKVVSRIESDVYQAGDFRVVVDDGDACYTDDTLTNYCKDLLYGEPRSSK